MIDCSEMLASVMFYSKLNIAVSVLNIISWIALIYCSVMVRKAARTLRKTAEDMQK